MASDQVEESGRADAPDAFDLALKQSREVKAKVETCADDLATANEIMKANIAVGTTMLSAHATLLAGTTVEGTVQECADDLHELTEILAQGVDDLAQAEIELTESRVTLATTRAALAISQGEEREARRRALHDSMTGLPNRDLFDDRLSHAISLARRHDWTLAVKASIGVAVFPVDGATGEELIESADAAMYRAKKQESGGAFFVGAGTESASASA